MNPTWSHLGERSPVWPGRNWPLGATWSSTSTNFAVHAPRATAVWVCVLEDDGDDGAFTETRHLLTEQSLGIWHGALPGIAPGTRYGFRARGPWDPARGCRFNEHQLLLDPFARAVSGDLGSGPGIYAHDVDDPSRPSTVDSAPVVPHGVVVDETEGSFDWQGDRPLKRRWRDTVVYEAHVKGLTAAHPDVPTELRGTYAGLAHPAVTDYLRDLGVTAVELLPVQQFVSEPFLAGRGLSNYWGYNTLGFLAPHGAYAAAGDRGGQVREFKEMVRSLHEAGLEVILDVVYNHTAEAGPLGPTLSFRGLDDSIYTRPEATPDPTVPPPVSTTTAPPPAVDGTGATDQDQAPDEAAAAPAAVRPEDVDPYWDVTGCGNTVDAGHPFALRLILDSLRYWVTEMHVDGFRFDLLPALCRVDRRVDMAAPLLTAIGQDPILRHVKLVAEPWDASGEGYQVGGFPPPWVEWNDQYRDQVRDFWRGHGDGIRSVATRLAGSSDLYADDGRSPYNSVNMVTAHDGFTLRDLVTYDHKHNEANGEDNRDGTDGNRSWNHGVEGETDDEGVVALRQRQAANLMATLCLSAGVPMIVAGDERGRTQHGNNNAYCQDNAMSWVDWRPEASWPALHRLTRAALALRRSEPALRQRHWFEGRPTMTGGPKDLVWLHPTGREMTSDDWHDDGQRVVGMFVSGTPLRSPGPRGEQQVVASFLMWFNAGPDAVTLSLPDNDWVRQGAVALSTDPDHAVGEAVLAGQELGLAGRSVVVLRQTGT
ncbi:glycogen debranching protein [Nocardioides sp. AX2bis]|uniref:glycogen debranching protein n=1 Tax=Nocardioides sp. AX2bis TaxID=2653157 RepID=UPI001EEA7609|nr:alpha-amylase family glycosyl hydrolase [Nocardioides sp. AX2bis]